MAPRDVDALRARLAAIAGASRALSAQLEDLFVYAYDRHAAGGDGRHRRGSASDPLDDGNPIARALWHRLETELKAAETTVVGLARGVGNLLSAGPGPEETRGSLIRKTELKGAIKRQSRRSAAGEYTPRRLTDQPPYPGGSQ